MYIIIRAWSGGDGRVTRTGQFWQYGIWQVTPGFEAEVAGNLAYFNNAKIIPDNLARADRFLHADLNHALAIKPLADGKVAPSYEDLIQATNDYTTGEHKKQIYYLTDQDKSDACELLKLILDAHISNWTQVGMETDANNLRADIHASTDLIAVKKLMETYFNVTQHWKRSELDAARVHNVNYHYHPDHKLAKHV